MIMRNAILMLLAACVFMPMLCGCSNDEEDWLPGPILIEFKISVVNADGEDLLDPQTIGNILSEPMTYTDKGVTYKIKPRGPEDGLPPTWLPIGCLTNDRYGKPIIFIGPFGGENLTPRPIDLTLAGIKHTISWTTKEIPSGADKPYHTYAYRLYLDGEEVVSAFDKGTRVNLTLVLDR